MPRRRARSRPGPKTAICLRLDDALVAQVDLIAEEEERSRADVVRRLVKRALSSKPTAARAS